MKKLRQYKFDGGMLFLIFVAIFAKATHALNEATDGGKKPTTWEQVYEAAGPVQSANHDRYND